MIGLEAGLDGVFLVIGARDQVLAGDVGLACLAGRGARLRVEFGVSLFRAGRMCVAGLNTGNVERTASAMAAVLA